MTNLGPYNPAYVRFVQELSSYTFRSNNPESQYKRKGLATILRKHTKNQQLSRSLLEVSGLSYIEFPLDALDNFLRAMTGAIEIPDAPGIPRGVEKWSRFAYFGGLCFVSFYRGETVDAETNIHEMEKVAPGRKSLQTILRNLDEAQQTISDSREDLNEFRTKSLGYRGLDDFLFDKLDEYMVSLAAREREMRLQRAINRSFRN